MPLVVSNSGYTLLSHCKCCVHNDANLPDEKVASTDVADFRDTESPLYDSSALSAAPVNQGVMSLSST